MEKAGLIKVLDELKSRELNLNRLTTDWHCQIKKYMREEEEKLIISLMYGTLASQLKRNCLLLQRKSLVKN